jgi:hypothetical protein
MNWIARIFMGLLGLALFAVLLAGLCIYIGFAALRWLLTGRKPQVVMVWEQLSKLRKGARWGAQPDFGKGPDASDHGDVVDVEAREVRPDRQSPQLLK